MLGKMMIIGKGGPVELDQGHDLWEKAAAAGHPEAKTNLSKLTSHLRGAGFSDGI